ncbi:hypothetical protein HBI56_106800 [Parastagonospora nodorum]|nr:hypothetical protein HBH52_134530 [Parastagonospora nodorum]KAH3995866.1 hypothetical protein HBI10_165640 [Parastagonospora nodorum]KAH4021745.1 hypothetical protein HBI13_106890 [Parastagonospora nodorum]KAH4030492.1 hypothetical protein HBI09_130360 [Parastagonospora nodorum]KAH4066942.1 hypothetical protein HBH50_145080 [Parastagonospora nodorum]
MHCAVNLAFYVLTDHTSSSHQQLLPGLAWELRAKTNSLVKQTFVKHHIPRQAWSLQAMNLKILSEATTAFSYTPNHFEETTFANSS